MTRIAQKPKPFRVGSIRRRFGAVLLSLVSLAALGVVVLLPPWREMQQAQAARRAAEPFLAARRLIEPLLEYRRVAGEWVARTGRTDSQQLTRHTEQVEALLHALESTVCQPGFDESRSAVTTLRSEWEAVRHQITQWSQTGEFAIYAEHAAGLLQPMRQLAAAAGRAWPEVQLLAVLVADVDDLSQTAFTIRHASRSRRFERETQGRISRLLGRLESRHSLLPDSLRTASRADMIREIEQEVVRDPMPIEETVAARIGRLADATILAELQLADQHLAEWSNRLDHRVTESGKNALLTGLALIAALIAALGAAYLVLRAWPAANLPAAVTPAPVAEQTEGPRNGPIRALLTELDDTADEAEVTLENTAIRLASVESAAVHDVDRSLERLRQLRTRLQRLQESLGFHESPAPVGSAEN